MNPESLQRTSHVLFWCSIGLPILGAVAGVARYYVDRQGGAQLRARVETLAEYSEVAKLNFIDTSGGVIAPLVEQSDISRALQTAVEVKNDNAQFKCDDASIAIKCRSCMGVSRLQQTRAAPLKSAKRRRGPQDLSCAAVAGGVATGTARLTPLPFGDFKFTLL